MLGQQCASTNCRTLGWLFGLVFFCSTVMIALALAPVEAGQRPSPAIEPASLYFVAVGSADYPYMQHVLDKAGQKTETPERSARRVAEALQSAGARYGILLTSRLGESGTAMVTRDDIMSAVVRLKAQIRKDRPVAPRIVFYFMGHGYGDEVGRYLYLLPGNIEFIGQASQTTTLRLIKSTTWSIDIVSALVNFRMHRSMQYLDDFFPSQVMPDFTNPADFGAALVRGQELDAIDQSQRNAGLYPPEGNPPVPFLALFDNCYSDVVTNLVPVLPEYSSIIDDLLTDLETDGLVLYAVKPGARTGDVHDPDVDAKDYGPYKNRLGPLAARLILALRGQSGSKPVTFAQLRDAMMADIPEGQPGVPDVPAVPYSVSTLSDDVSIVEFFPMEPSTVSGGFDRLDGQGRAAVQCCGLP